MRIEGRTHMRPVIEKELLHYDILFALDSAGLLDLLTFQGGTSLRLCYGAPRFSEDLDFTGGKHFISADLLAIKHCIETYIGARYGLEVIVKDPKQLALEFGNEDLKVDKWQITVITSSDRRDIPRQKIKIEVVNIPSYSRTPQPIKLNYDFLPDGYKDTLIMVESLDEIYADKCISLVNSQKYIRHRDIWDLRWLKQEGAMINADFIRDKIQDYRITDYLAKLDIMVSRLDEIIYSPSFRQEMSRFIPLDTQERTLAKDKFYAFLLTEVKSILIKVKQMLQGTNKDEPFFI